LIELFACSMAAFDAAAAGAGTAEVEAPAEPEVVVSGEEPEAQKPAEVPKTQDQQARGDLKRKRDVEDLTKKAERLEKDAGLAEDCVKQTTAAVQTKAEELRKLEEELQKRQERAAVARRVALRARQEAALHDCPPVPKKPANPFNIFQTEIMPKVVAESLPSGKRPIQRVSELWNQLSPAEKKKYTDRYYQEMKEYTAWERSEEGKVIIAKRHEIQKAYAQGDTQEPDTKASPAAKRAKAAKEPTTTPVKPQRGPAAKQRPLTAPAAVEPYIEVAVLKEAIALGLQGQLHNLAARPEVQTMKKSSQELLKALKDSGGLVNAAKNIILASGVH